MRRRWSTLLGAVLLGVGAAASAAVPVEERAVEPRQTYQRPSTPVQPAAAPQQSATGSSGQLAELFYELQVLRQEVQDLRGRVEEQSHRLERLARDQQEQYLDLDRRMQALRGGAGGGRPAGAGAGPSGPSLGETAGRLEPEPGPGTSAFTTGQAPGSEREAYTRAFELMKQRQFDQSVQAFNRLIADYPNGAYTPNAFYWLGELYLAQDDNERARQSFAQVVNLYPDHQKVPDALYKLGVAYHRLGDVERAREYLNRVIREHGNSSAAGLARTYLQEL